MKTPLVSIIIVNWNGAQWLEKCINSVLDQKDTEHEIIVVDNASTDTSVSLIQSTFPTVQLIQNSDNLGFATGCNIGIQHAKGTYFLFLNTDAWLAPNFFPPLIQEFEKHQEVAAISPKVLNAEDPSKLDNCGSFWSTSTFLYHYGYHQRATKRMYAKPRLFFSLKGAIFFVRRSHLEMVGGFDDDFWCYYEETDLCHRFWLAGFTCLYYPMSIGYHHGGKSAEHIPNEFLMFHNFKNHLQSFIKNFSVWTLAYVLPTNILVLIATSIAWAAQGNIHKSYSAYKAMFWTAQHLPLILKKRKNVQALRKVSDGSFLPPLKKNPPWKYFVKVFILSRTYDDK